MATSSNNGVECQECNEVGVGGIDESVAGPSRGSNVLSSSLQEQNQVALSSTSNAVDPVSNQERDHEEDVMNPSTFVPMPIGQGGPAVYIEYCDRVSSTPKGGRENGASVAGSAESRPPDASLSLCDDVLFQCRW